MGTTKSEKFTADQNRIAALAKALAHPARIAILQHLLQTNACVCGDLVEEIGLAQATISQHLAELKKADLLQGNIEGTRVCYCINPQTWRDAETTFRLLFAKFQNPSDCCQ